VGYLSAANTHGGRIDHHEVRVGQECESNRHDHEGSRESKEQRCGEEASQTQIKEMQMKWEERLGMGCDWRYVTS
jgi:hypothetical protein